MLEGVLVMFPIAATHNRYELDRTLLSLLHQAWMDAWVIAHQGLIVGSVQALDDTINIQSIAVKIQYLYGP